MTIDLFVMLFALASAVAMLARWLRIPYTVALVVAGLALGSTRSLSAPRLTKDLLYNIFLPGLLFEAAFHLEFKRFWQNKLAIGSLAIPGLIVSILLTAALLTPAAEALHFVEGFALIHGLVFGALIAATDPIAVVALFKSLGAPRRLAVLTEGESLLNDGTGVVVFTLILAVAVGGQFSAGGAVLDFIRVVGVGAFIGAAVGYGISKVIQLVDDPMIEITLTTVAAYGSFALAERFHYSGVIATVVAGMLCGNYGARTGMTPSTRVAVESFWEYLAFALNSVVFLLIGFEVRVETLLASWKPIMVAYLAVTIGRAVTTYLVTALLRRTRERLPWSWATALTWGGLRGGLSMVLVLGLPAGFPHRDLLVTMTFGVVILSILIQGLTMPPLLRWLGLAGGGHDLGEYQLERGRARACNEALRALERMADEKTVAATIVETVRAEYAARLGETEARLRVMHEQASDLAAEEERAIRQRLLVVEKDAIIAAYREGTLGEEAHQKLLTDVDARLVELGEGGHGGS